MSLDLNNFAVYETDGIGLIHIKLLRASILTFVHGYVVRRDCTWQLSDSEL